MELLNNSKNLFPFSNYLKFNSALSLKIVYNIYIWRSIQTQKRMDSIKLSFNIPKLKKLRTIYVIEDNAIERNMLIDFLGKYPDLNSKEFFNGDACIKDIIVSKISPDLILLDYFLDSEIASSKDGLEILTKLKEISPNSEIIMFTSVDNERIIELARKKGAMAFIVKGASGYEMLDSIIRNNFSRETTQESN